MNDEPNWKWAYHTDKKLRVGQIMKMDDPLGKNWQCLITGKWVGKYPDGDTYTLYHLQAINIFRQIFGWRLDYLREVWRNRKALKNLWGKYRKEYTLDTLNGEYPDDYLVENFDWLCSTGKWSFYDWCIKKGYFVSFHSKEIQKE